MPGPYPVVVFGDRHADVPLDEGMGRALGRLVGTHQIACVVDVSDLGSAAARRGFMTAFAEALYEANSAPLHLVLDEADLWAPQRAQPDGYDLLRRVEEIVRRGRIRGFVPWLITQRPAVLHKDVLSQADILVSMKLTSSQDREAVGRWIEGQAERAEEGTSWPPCPGSRAARVGCGRPATACWRGWPSRASAPSTARPCRTGPSASGRRAGWRWWTWRQSGRRWPGDREQSRGTPRACWRRPPVVGLGPGPVSPAAEAPTLGRVGTGGGYARLRQRRQKRSFNPTAAERGGSVIPPQPLTLATR